MLAALAFAWIARSFRSGSEPVAIPSAVGYILEDP
jgi:iron-sulfur cluster assembly accessory protein